jgi:hypothetical protein
LAQNIYLNDINNFRPQHFDVSEQFRCSSNVSVLSSSLISDIVRMWESAQEFKAATEEIQKRLECKLLRFTVECVCSVTHTQEQNLWGTRRIFSSLQIIVFTLMTGKVSHLNYCGIGISYESDSSVCNQNTLV